jgi:hypothetical protein
VGVTYDGSAQTPCAATVTGAGGLNQSVSVDYTDNVNAGTATARANFAGDANHNASGDSRTFVISKASATITLNGLGSFIYDGTAKTATATTAPAGLEMMSITYNGSAAAPVSVGSYAVVAALVNPNYEGQATGTITIGPWTINGYFQPVDMGTVVNGVKGGAAVALKFRVFAGATELTDPAVVVSLQQIAVACDSGAVVSDIPIEDLTTDGTSVRYDSLSGHFVARWKAPKGAGNCYDVVTTTRDGSAIRARFKAK